MLAQHPGREQLDFHGRQTTLKWILRKIGSELPEHNAKLILKNDYYEMAQGKKVSSRCITLAHLYKAAKMYGDRPIDGITREDILVLVNMIDANGYSIHTANRFKMVLKRFIAFMGKGKMAGEIRTLSSRKLYEQSVPEVLLTSQEMREIVDFCPDSMSKALLSLLSETGLRIEEAITLKSNCIQFYNKDPVGAKLVVNGKTGKRVVPLIRCRCNSPNLACNLLAEIINYDNEYVFMRYNRLRGKDAVLSYNQVMSLFGHINAAKVIKKHIHPHMFRHTVASRLYNWLTPIQLCDHMGWKRDSPMIGIYGRGCDLQTTNALLRGYGMKEISPQGLCVWC